VQVPLQLPLQYLIAPIPAESGVQEPLVQAHLISLPEAIEIESVSFQTKVY